jgi:carboxymethylenebutenolidase
MPTETLTAADGHTLSAYVGVPAGARHGLVVVQEIFGVNGHIRNVCDRFAAQGYAVVSPALFDRTERGVELGYQPPDIARGRELRGRVADADTLADIEAAAARLGQLVPGGRRGIVGYCWGGSVAWAGATRMDAFAAASCWYGGAIVQTKDAAPHCPVQMHFGEQDASIPLADVEAIRAAQPGVAIHVYAGAQHGFGCDERASFSKPDADLAQARTLEFFAAHLN